jgi:hypothetical protein
MDPSDKPDSDDEPDSDEEPNGTPKPRAKAKSGVITKSRANGPQLSKDQVKSSRKGKLLPGNDDRDVTSHCQIKGKVVASQIEAEDCMVDAAISPGKVTEHWLGPAPVAHSTTGSIIPSDIPVSRDIATSGADTLFDDLFDFTPDSCVPEGK